MKEEETISEEEAILNNINMLEERLVILNAKAKAGFCSAYAEAEVVNKLINELYKKLNGR